MSSTAQHVFSSHNPSPAFHPGLEGVIAFQSEIAEPDRDGGALRYRGIAIEELVAVTPFETVWGLLVDGWFGDALPLDDGGALPARTGDPRVDAQAGLVLLASSADFAPLLDIGPEQARTQLARASAGILSYTAQSARGAELPLVPRDLLDGCSSAAERFLTQWHGEPDPAQIQALDAYWVSAAEHGLSASTFTARVIASTGADVATALSGAMGAMSGPLHGGAPARVLPLIEESEHTGDPKGVVTRILDRGERLMGFGHRVYRAEDPRARVLRDACRRLGVPRYEVAAELERAALATLRERRPDRQIETNVEFWAAVILDFAAVPPAVMPALFICARTAGWSAHILEEKRTGRLVRPSSQYIGPGPRPAQQVQGWPHPAAR
jgi:citrate synthase